MSNDLLWLCYSVLYVGLVLAVGTLARQGGRRSPDLTRKIVHIGVGSWIIPTTVMFTNPLLAALPPAVFTLVNIASWRFRLVAAMEEGDRNPGTIYFPIAFVLLILLYWPGASARLLGLPAGAEADHLWARLPIAAGIMAMAWGDAAGAIVGRRQRILRFAVPGGGTKSLLGSLACGFWAFLGIEAAALALGLAAGHGAVDCLVAATPAAAVAGLVGMTAEAWTPFGLDNLSVPLSVAWTVHWLASRPPAPLAGV